MKNINKTVGYDRTKKLTRIPIQVAKALKGNDYKFMDYILFRNGLEDYQIRISTMVEELGVSKPTVLDLCKDFLNRGFLTQMDSVKLSERCYKIDYKACESFIYNVIDTEKTTGKESLPELVKNIDQTGKETLPTTGKESLPELVKNIDHTRSIKNVLKESLQESLQEPEILVPVISTEDLLEQIKQSKLSSSPEKLEEKEILVTNHFREKAIQYLTRITGPEYTPSEESIKETERRMRGYKN